MLIKLVFQLLGLRTLYERENNDESHVGQNWKEDSSIPLFLLEPETVVGAMRLEF